MPKYPSTPAAPCIYPALHRPMNKYQSEEKEYKATLIFDADHEWVKEMTEKWTKMAKEEIAKRAKDAKPAQKKKMKEFRLSLPFRPEVDDEGNETGRVLVPFKQDAEHVRQSDGKRFTFSVAVFDAKGTPIKKDIKVGSDSILRVGYEERPYVMPATEKYGVSLRLKAAQVLKLVEYVPGGNADAYGFETDEDGFDFSAVEDQYEFDGGDDSYDSGDDVDDGDDGEGAEDAADW